MAPILLRVIAVIRYIIITLIKANTTHQATYQICTSDSLSFASSHIEKINFNAANIIIGIAKITTAFIINLVALTNIESFNFTSPSFMLQIASICVSNKSLASA